MAVVVESVYFFIFVFFVTLVTLAILGYNIYLFEKIRVNPSSEITSGTATWAIVLNGILVFIFAIVLIWSIIAIVRVLTERAPAAPIAVAPFIQYAPQPVPPAQITVNAPTPIPAPTVVSNPTPTPTVTSTTYYGYQ